MQVFQKCIPYIKGFGGENKNNNYSIKEEV